MKPFKIAEGVYSVGVVDWNIRDFHGYSTKNGTTYNAFLIIDDKVTLIDTVKKEFADQLLDNISKIIDPGKIDYVVSNHTEMDHSGGLPKVMDRIGKDKPIYCSKMGLKNLKLHFRNNLNYIAVKNGEDLVLGKKTLTFLETRMIHWPDSMFTYLKEDGILFSSDGFGQHYAGFEKYADQLPEEIMKHAKKYFANILWLYAPRIKKLISQVSDLNLGIKIICPDHGLLWRKNPGQIIEQYMKWCDQAPEKKAVIVYDTMWKSTEQMANKIAEGISDEGVYAYPMSLGKCHRSDVITEIFDAKAIIVGSPTLNNNLFPTVADFLTYMKGLKPQGKIGTAFGSYGWSGESVKLINTKLEEMNIDIVDPGLRIQYVPDRDAIETCLEFGHKLGKTIMID